MKERILQKIILDIHRLWATPVTNASEAYCRAEKLTRLEKLKDKYNDKNNFKLERKINNISSKPQRKRKTNRERGNL